jgi:hypothetical protein
MIIMTQLLLHFSCSSAFVHGSIHFLEDGAEEIFEVIKLLIAALYHIIDGFHDLLSVVAALLLPEYHLLCLADLAYQVKLGLPLVVYVGNGST